MPDFVQHAGSVSNLEMPCWNVISVCAALLEISQRQLASPADFDLPNPNRINGNAIGCQKSGADIFNFYDGK